MTNNEAEQQRIARGLAELAHAAHAAWAERERRSQLHEDFEGAHPRADAPA